jgi:flagellin
MLVGSKSLTINKNGHGCPLKFKEEFIMIINHNMNAMNAHRNMAINTAASGKSMEKLSSGLRINRAGDDAAGLAISEKMRGQIRGLDQASRNGQDSISLIQTAEGALNETHSILQRMRELAVQSSNDTNTSTDRTALQDEMKQLTGEVNRIANTTEFNTKKLLNGDLEGVQDAKAGVLNNEATFTNGNVDISAVANATQAAITDVIRINILDAGDGTNVTGMTISVSSVLGNVAAGSVKISTGGIQISGAASTGAANADVSMNLTGAAGNLKSGDTITISLNSKAAAKTDSTKQVRAQIGANSGQELGIGINAMDSSSLGIQDTAGNALDITSQSKASGAITLVNNAIAKVSTERSKLGAFQNRLEHTINNLNTSSENLQASESRIRDVDMAKEMTEYSKNNILTQAAQAMLAQAKSAPEAVLQLLR